MSSGAIIFGYPVITVESINNIQIVDALSAAELNNTIVFSNNLNPFPSISEAVDRLEQGAKQNVLITGGVNEVNGVIRPPIEGSQSQPAGIKTAPGTVFKMADNAVNRVLDLNTGHFDVNVAIDGNRDNNSGTMRGVRCINVRDGSRVRAQAVNCDIGVRIDDRSENARYEIGVGDCDVVVLEEQGPDGQTPDGNIINVYDRPNGGLYYRKTTNTSTELRVGIETTENGNNGVELEAGYTSITGSIRSISGIGINATGTSRVVARGVHIGSVANIGLNFKGDFGAAIGCLINNIDGGTSNDAIVHRTPGASIGNHIEQVDDGICVESGTPTIGANNIDAASQRIVTNGQHEELAVNTVTPESARLETILSVKGSGVTNGKCRIPPWPERSSRVIY